MATPDSQAEYELVLMLDPEAPDERREQIASTTRERIEAGGALKHDSVWGVRNLAYEIEQRHEADYRFFRFETGGPLLDELSHNLKIADGVLRFRIFKVDPRAPAIVPPSPSPAASPAPRRERREGGDAPARVEASAEPAAAGVAAAEPEAPATDKSAEPPAETASEAAEPAPAAEPEAAAEPAAAAEPEAAAEPSAEPAAPEPPAADEPAPEPAAGDEQSA